MKGATLVFTSNPTTSASTNAGNQVSKFGIHRHVTSRNQGTLLEVERGPWERG